jgi:hypothetical protein
MKLQFSQLYANVSKVELSSIMSRELVSDGFVLWVASLALIHLDITIIIRND